MSLGKKVRNLDIFKKVPVDLAESTNVGGAVSILTVLLIGYLVFKQFSSYMNPQYTAQINFDKLVTRDEMTINLDIEFPAFPCEVISLDLQDIMISHHPNIGSVEKWRLDKAGNYLDKRPFQLLHQQSPMRQIETVREAFKRQYGCRLVGSFTVKQVPGNFHVSCHAYFNHFMQMKLQGVANTLNMSHKIHKLYFGTEHLLDRLKQDHPQAEIHLLQNKTVVETRSRSIHYHLDIVPTWYHEGTLANYYTYQYTYKQNPYAIEGQPGVIHFNYNIGGLMVQVTPREQTFSAFLIHLCAIVGGTYALCQALYNLLHNFLPKHEYQLLK